ncbi:hypothetical protein AB0368_19600 [Actinoplanes sp. NPDC051475]|uniref:hypothetical protein n=1 Tax=Actinoplanes sp. NPDC051475 TaxID=3157225 RepID=UPI003450402A
MPIEAWMVQQAAELALHTANQLSTAASAVHHETQILLEEITDTVAAWGICGVDGGCHIDLQH